MSTLTLVRHAQASYMAEDYDQLSALGEQQSVRLGSYFARNDLRWDRIFCGPARRHRQTCELVGEQYARVGISWPEPVAIPDLDEFDALSVLKAMLPVLIDRDERVRRLHADFRATEDTPEAGRRLQRLFEELARHWATGEFEIPHIESWARFHARVNYAVKRIREVAGRSTATLVFTSGGPIAATVSAALDLTPARSLELVWTSRNSSYTEFLFSAERFSLSSYNSFPHLDRRELLTYR